MEQEIKNVVGYECFYTVSSSGIIANRDGHILKQAKDKHGYFNVALCNRVRKGKTTKVHRIVAIAFIPNPENKPQVNHKDRNRTNNNVSNLEWVTNKENAIHSFNNGRKGKQDIFGEKHYCALLTNKQVLEIRELIKQGKTTKEISIMFGVGYYVIFFVKNGTSYKRVK